MRMLKHGSCLLVFALLAASVTSRAQVSVACKNAAVDTCFRSCDVILFDQCVTGCISGYEDSPLKCKEECAGLPFCEGKCFEVLRTIANCSYVTGDLTATCGAIVLNRSTGQWQQTVQIRNTTSTSRLENVGFVLDSLAPGWTLSNGNGVTSDLTPTGNPYKNVGTIEPGATARVTLQFARTGTLPFGYIIRVVTGNLR